MGKGVGRAVGQEEAVEHLEEALGTADATEKEFHIRQALQLLEVASSNE